MYRRSLYFEHENVVSNLSNGVLKPYFISRKRW